MSNGTTKAKGQSTSAAASAEKDAAAEGRSYEKASGGEGEPERYEKTAKSDKGKRYSKGTKGFQKVAEGANRSAERVAEGLADGLREYRKRSEGSARDKKDGMIQDFPLNVAKGLGEAIRTASEAPADLAKELKPKRLRKLLRQIPFSPF